MDWIYILIFILKVQFYVGPPSAHITTSTPLRLHHLYQGWEIVALYFKSCVCIVWTQLMKMSWFLLNLIMSWGATHGLECVVPDLDNFCKIIQCIFVKNETCNTILKSWLKMFAVVKNDIYICLNMKWIFGTLKHQLTGYTCF